MGGSSAEICLCSGICACGFRSSSYGDRVCFTKSHPVPCHKCFLFIFPTIVFTDGSNDMSGKAGGASNKNMEGGWSEAGYVGDRQEMKPTGNPLKLYLGCYRVSHASVLGKG